MINAFVSCTRIGAIDDGINIIKSSVYDTLITYADIFHATIRNV